MSTPPADFLQPGSLTTLSIRNQFFILACATDVHFRIFFFRKSHLKKIKKPRRPSFNHRTLLRVALHCSLTRTSRLSTMQHLKVLLVLLFVAAVSISLTEAWVVSNKKVGKRKKLLPFSYYGLKKKGK